MVRLLVHWRTWWNAASVVFAAWLLAVLSGVSPPQAVESLFPLALPVSVALFLVGFARLAWHQRNDAE